MSWRKQCVGEAALRPGFSAAGCEFNVIESTINIKESLNRNAHRTRFYIDQLMKML